MNVMTAATSANTDLIDFISLPSFLIFIFLGGLVSELFITSQLCNDFGLLNAIANLTKILSWGFVGQIRNIDQKRFQTPKDGLGRELAGHLGIAPENDVLIQQAARFSFLVRHINFLIIVR